MFTERETERTRDPADRSREDGRIISENLAIFTVNGYVVPTCRASGHSAALGNDLRELVLPQRGPTDLRYLVPSRHVHTSNIQNH